MHIFRLKLSHFSQRLEKLVRRISDELEVEHIKHVCFHVRELSSCVLPSAGSNELFEMRNLVSLLKLGSYEKSCDSY